MEDLKQGQIAKRKVGGRLIFLGNCQPTSTRDNPNQGRIYAKSGICPAIVSASDKQAMIIVKR